MCTLKTTSQNSTHENFLRQYRQSAIEWNDVYGTNISLLRVMTHLTEEIKTIAAGKKNFDAATAHHRNWVEATIDGQRIVLFFIQ